MKKILLLLLLTKSVFGQISGKIQDKDSRPVPFANIILMSVQDSIIVAGTAADESGIFKLGINRIGQYIIRVSSIGYQNSSTKTLIISNITETLEIEPIVLKEENNSLGEVTISAKRDLVQTTAIGKIINIQNNILTKGSNALQVLERLPGVITDRRNNQFSLNGQNGVTVLFNGRKVQMPIEEVMALLENTVADNIEKIELIT